MLVIAREKTTLRVMSRTTVAQLPVKVLPSRSRGWKDLAVAIHGGGVTPGFARLTFKGQGYTANPTVAPRVEADHAKILIPADDHGEPLTP